MSRPATRPNGVLRAVAWLLLAALVVAGCASSSGQPAPSSILGTALNQPVPSAIVGLPLTDASGHTTSLSAFRGKTVVLCSSMTLCQEICPLLAANFVYLARRNDDCRTCRRRPVRPAHHRPGARHPSPTRRLPATVQPGPRQLVHPHLGPAARQHQRHLEVLRRLLPESARGFSARPGLVDRKAADLRHPAQRRDRVPRRQPTRTLPDQRSTGHLRKAASPGPRGSFSAPKVVVT